MNGIQITKIFLATTIALFCIGNSNAQNVFTIRNVDSISAIKNKKVDDYDQIFMGNVFLEEQQKDIKFFCDSAYKHSESQIIEAFGNVQVSRGDTIDLQGDYMSFDLETSFLKVRENAKLEHSRATLTTDSLDYDLNEELGVYNYGGKLVDSTNVLTSIIGKYFASTGDVFFKDDVHIVGEEYTIDTDSLRYNVNSNKVFIIAPTDFVSEDYKMYTEKGVYDTNTGISNFTQATQLVNENYILTGDNLVYNDAKGVGILTDNCKLVDTTNNIILKSEYMKSIRRDSSVLAVDSIELQYLMEKDTLFAHSDTIFVHKDSTYNQVLEIYRKVKFFKTDIQGKCDSMSFSEVDSTMRMFYDPIIWSGDNQLSSDTITANFIDGKLRYINLLKNAMAISVEDSTRNFYTQMKGRNMKAFIINDTLKNIEVYGNGESIYFAKDKNKLTGINHIKSSDISIHLKDQRLHNIVFKTNPVGTMNPISFASDITLYLAGFKWNENNRPQKREDIFHWNNAPALQPQKATRDVITEDEPIDTKEDNPEIAKERLDKK